MSLGKKDRKELFSWVTKYRLLLEDTNFNDLETEEDEKEKFKFEMSKISEDESTYSFKKNQSSSNFSPKIRFHKIETFGSEELTSISGSQKRSDNELENIYIDKIFPSFKDPKGFPLQDGEEEEQSQSVSKLPTITETRKKSQEEDYFEDIDKLYKDLYPKELDVENMEINDLVKIVEGSDQEKEDEESWESEEGSSGTSQESSEGSSDEKDSEEKESEEEDSEDEDSEEESEEEESEDEDSEEESEEEESEEEESEEEDSEEEDSENEESDESEEESIKIIKEENKEAKIKNEKDEIMVIDLSQEEVNKSLNVLQVDKEQPLQQFIQVEEQQKQTTNERQDLIISPSSQEQIIPIQIPLQLEKKDFSKAHQKPKKRVKVKSKALTKDIIDKLLVRVHLIQERANEIDLMEEEKEAIKQITQIQNLLVKKPQIQATQNLIKKWQKKKIPEKKSSFLKKQVPPIQHNIKKPEEKKTQEQKDKQPDVFVLINDLIDQTQEQNNIQNDQQKQEELEIVQNETSPQVDEIIIQHQNKQEEKPLQQPQTQPERKDPGQNEKKIEKKEEDYEDYGDYEDIISFNTATQNQEQDEDQSISQTQQIINELSFEQNLDELIQEIEETKNQQSQQIQQQKEEKNPLELKPILAKINLRDKILKESKTLQEVVEDEEGERENSEEEKQEKQKEEEVQEVQEEEKEEKEEKEGKEEKEEKEGKEAKEAKQEMDEKEENEEDNQQDIQMFKTGMYNIKKVKKLKRIEKNRLRIKDIKKLIQQQQKKEQEPKRPRRLAKIVQKKQKEKKQDEKFSKAISLVNKIIQEEDPEKQQKIIYQAKQKPDLQEAFNKIIEPNAVRYQFQELTAKQRERLQRLKKNLQKRTNQPANTEAEKSQNKDLKDQDALEKLQYLTWKQEQEILMKAHEEMMAIVQAEQQPSLEDEEILYQEVEIPKQNIKNIMYKEVQQLLLEKRTLVDKIGKLRKIMKQKQRQGQKYDQEKWTIKQTMTDLIALQALVSQKLSQPNLNKNQEYQEEDEEEDEEEEKQLNIKMQSIEEGFI